MASLVPSIETTFKLLLFISNLEPVKTGLVSIPLRNMHSDVEIIDVKDIKNVCDLLEKYILGGNA